MNITPLQIYFFSEFPVGVCHGRTVSGLREIFCIGARFPGDLSSSAISCYDFKQHRPVQYMEGIYKVFLEATLV